VRDDDLAGWVGGRRRERRRRRREERRGVDGFGLEVGC